MQSSEKVICILVTQNIDDFDAKLIKASKILMPEPSFKEEEEGT